MVVTADGVGELERVALDSCMLDKLHLKHALGAHAEEEKCYEKQGAEDDEHRGKHEYDVIRHHVDPALQPMPPHSRRQLPSQPLKLQMKSRGTSTIHSRHMLCMYVMST